MEKLRELLASKILGLPLTGCVALGKIFDPFCLNVLGTDAGTVLGIKVTKTPGLGGLTFCQEKQNEPNKHVQCPVCVTGITARWEEGRGVS